MLKLPTEVQKYLEIASQPSRVASTGFQSNVCGDQWDRFIETNALKACMFVAQALGPYQKLPLRTILPLEPGAHSSGANASFEPATGQIRLCSSVVHEKPGITLEKLTHELVHASLNDFPEGDEFFEEGYVDYTTWVLAHAPVWGPHRDAMIKAAAFNIECRRDRAMKSLSEYDAKRWAGGVFASKAYGPWIVTKLAFRKREGNLSWI